MERSKSRASSGTHYYKTNLYAQIEELQDYILNREEGNRFPDRHEVMMQYKLVTAIFKFPDYGFEEIKDIYTELFEGEDFLEKKYPARDKELKNITDGQALSKNVMDKEGIKKDKEMQAQTNPGDKNTHVQKANSGPLDNYTPKKNIVLRSGVRWLEKGIVYDPSIRQNRKLTKIEYDELIRKGLTKKDFQGWSPA